MRLLTSSTVCQFVVFVSAAKGGGEKIASSSFNSAAPVEDSNQILPFLFPIPNLIQIMLISTFLHFDQFSFA